MEPKRQHYFLITGEVSYRDADPTILRHEKFNGILCTDEPRLRAKALGRCQEAIQLNFHERYKDQGIPLQVETVVILNLAHLGQFTSDEFHSGMEGTK